MRIIAPALALLALGTTPLAAQSPSNVPPLYLGADLSFANEMQDCGAVFRYQGKPVDPFELVKLKGGNLVRVRIWNNPTRTHYSNLADVERTIRRAKAAGLQTLLDFHYSDDWADGDKQNAPAAWVGLDTAGQAKALHDYTREVIDALAKADLTPEMVQVGNETNPELLSGNKKIIDWARNAALLNAGVRAVRESAAAANKPIRVMLHIAQPENAEPWFAAATAAGVTDYDIIGLSYYRKWSTEPMSGLGDTIARLRERYHRSVVLVETAYPYTVAPINGAHSLLGPDSLDPRYPATPKGQADYMIDVTQTVVDAGGEGVVYWAPDWIASACKPPVSANWENATWFDRSHRWEALPVIDFMNRPYMARRKAN
jgi:arabinogalactan endo-1,4-beta-galactosidase